LTAEFALTEAARGGSAFANFRAVVRAELLYNRRRVAPYVMAALFAANALLWWGWGAATRYGWAVNSDYYILRCLIGFTFMTTPFFVALLMGDPVVRDYRTRIDPLIFSKPLSRAEYLLGKFFGNYLVLLCCQFCFPLMLLALQPFARDGMVALPARFAPYFKHFLFFTAAPSLLLAAVCFAAGTLSRSVKLVYGLVTSLYVLYIGLQVSARGLPRRWRVLPDPLLMNAYTGNPRAHSADYFNSLAVSYDADMLLNRALVLLATAACLAFLYSRFSTTERHQRADRDAVTTLDLADAAGWVSGGASEKVATGDLAGGAASERRGLAGTARDENARDATGYEAAPGDVAARGARAGGAARVGIPRVHLSEGGLRAGARQFAAALATEFRLLRAERSLVIVVPAAVLLSLVSLAEFGVAAGAVSYSAAYAARAADTLLLFLFAAAVFYTGEAMHRDRELRVEPLLWSAPAPDYSLILSKLAATLLLSLSLVALVCLSVAALQLFKGHGPVEAGPYLTAAFVILLPGVVFMIAASAALNVLLREKHLAYVAALAACGMLIYSLNLGFTNALYNPVLYQLWTPADLAGAVPNRLLAHRLYTLALASHCLALAHLFFGRKFFGRLWRRGDHHGLGRSILATVITALAAVATGILFARA